MKKLIVLFVLVISAFPVFSKCKEIIGFGFFPCNSFNATLKGAKERPNVYKDSLSEYYTWSYGYASAIGKLKNGNRNSIFIKKYIKKYCEENPEQQFIQAIDTFDYERIDWSDWSDY